MCSTLKVSLLARNSIIREGLRRLLIDEQFDVWQSVEHHKLLTADSCESDLIILVDGDVTGDIVEQVETLRTRFPDVKLVVLSDQFDFDAMIGAFRAGAHGYLVKKIALQPLISSLRLVAMGEKVLPSCLADELPMRADGGHDDACEIMESAHLSERENEILQHLVMGCPNKVISRRLAISEETVKVHVKAILRKLRVKNRTQAAICAVEGGLHGALGKFSHQPDRVSPDAVPQRSPIMRVA